MDQHRRTLLKGLAATAAASGPLALVGRNAWAATELKISHQFPSGTATEGDFRDQLCRRFAEGIAKKTNNALTAQIFPGSSLMKVNSQISAMRKGALDLSLVPISYASGEVADWGIGLMPALVPNYAVAAKWKTSEAGRLLQKNCEDKGIIIVSWVWQGGGIASRNRPVINPDDAKGMKIRGGSREMDMMLKEAGASVISLPSNEIYAGMQTGAMEAAMTSSTSFISYKLEEVAKHLTTARDRTYWFMLEPLLMSKDVFSKLPKEQQDLIMATGAELEAFGTEAAKKDDKLCADVYTKAGAKCYDMDAAVVKKWQAIAERTAWKDYAEKNENCAKMMKAAQALL
jgi:TRAP-type C4-dicarboxylate transport system substrate-binding protein